MGKLPSAVLRRPSLLGGSSLPSPTTPSLSPAVTHPSNAIIATTLSSSLSPQPSLLLVRPPQQQQQVRHATYVLRHRRPYQFTQLVQLSDGSTFTVRTTSPTALYRSAKDSRNHVLWQPSEKALRNVEVDEAGKLAAFRERYGKGWDLEAPPTDATAAETAAAGAKSDSVAAQEGGKKEAGAAGVKAQTQAAEQDPFDSLVDLISAYATDDKNIKGGLSAKDQAKKDKGSKK